MVDEGVCNGGTYAFGTTKAYASRQDGFPGVQQGVYGFPTTDVKTFGTGAIYSSIANGTCNFGEIFTTDGRIAGLDLAVLADDKKFFPQYNVCVVLRDEFHRQHPEIGTVLQPIAAARTNDEMIELGKRVDVDGDDPGVVARDWMVKQGFIGADTA
ncbi:MAG TPA: glycine betaine ABC transporter substrate-binding protein [Pseudonocardia sp.]|nr:glycine betaine ABC transporter substrate-binding protein [Pseudonocardia sp.]